MKKLIALCAVALSMGAFADSYLYWMLDESSELTWKESPAPSYNAVKIGVVNNETGKNAGYLNIYAWGGTQMDTEYAVAAGSDGTSSLYANLGTYASSGYSYYIELLNDGNFVGRSSDTLNYSTTAAQIISAIGQTDLPASAQAWSPSSFTTAAIPEPTSGMLLLLGLAGLALKRKRA